MKLDLNEKKKKKRGNLHGEFLMIEVNIDSFGGNNKRGLIIRRHWEKERQKERGRA